MESEDEAQFPTTNGRIAVTVAAQPSYRSITLALPIQQQKSGGSGFGGGREDYWSEEATAVLINAWGERYLDLNRGNLKQMHWKDVAEAVNSRIGYSKTPKTDMQCKNRIDTVKKKYKTEKSKVVSGSGPSKWRFFDKFDEFIVPVMKINSMSPLSRSSSALRDKFPLQQKLCRTTYASNDDPESENSVDSLDALSPGNYKKPRSSSSGKNKTYSNERSPWKTCVRELTETILRFGEAYEQTESVKLQQLMEMEKQRMKFTKEMELQRMQCFMKTQMELSQMKNMGSGEDKD